MRHGKYERPKHLSVRKRKAAARRKRRILLLSLLLVLCVSVGGTLAYIVTQTEGVTNIFNPSVVSTKVNEDIETDISKKQNVTITNTGDTDAYIRATIIVNWVDADSKIYGSVPDGYGYTLDEGTGWTKNAYDGYYYYNSIVPAGGTTSNLIDSIYPNGNYDGYYLQVTILSSGVQAKPDDAVKAAWGFVPGNGN